jgi:hypothetical protein
VSGIDCRHSICDECWPRVHPGREPIRVTPAEAERCCYCGAETRAGIYIHDPAHERCIQNGWTRFGAVRFTRILVLEFERKEILCWRRRIVMADGTVYEGNEVGAPLADCLPHFTEAERAAVQLLPRVEDR